MAASKTADSRHWLTAMDTMTAAERRQCFNALTRLVEDYVEEGDHKDKLVSLLLSVQLHPPGGVGFQVGALSAAAAPSSSRMLPGRNLYGRFTQGSSFPTLEHDKLMELFWAATGSRNAKLPGDQAEPVAGARRKEKVKRRELLEGEPGPSSRLKKNVKASFDADLGRIFTVFGHRISGPVEGNQTAEFPNSVRKCPDCQDAFRFGVTQLGATKKNVQLAGLQVSSHAPQLT